jgi:pyruvate dehydrogenase E2 component (dihydrolipoamide acetyltransferase)
MTEHVDFTMPSLGSDMESGIVTEWLVGVGDAVKRGDIMAVVKTEKSDIDVEVWNDGTVIEILVQPGEEVPVGTPLARLSVSGADEPDASVVAGGTGAAAGSRTEDDLMGQSDAPVTPPAARAAGAGSSPLARRLAEEQGIDITTISGSGPGGAVVERDIIRQAAEEPGTPATPADVEAPSPSRAATTGSTGGSTDAMRRAIGNLMSRSKREIPHYYLGAEIDLEAALGWVERENTTRLVQERILPAAVLLKAVAATAAKYPEFNGFWIGDELQRSEHVHLGVAVSLRGGGLIAPAIHDADRLSVAELMAGLRDLVGRARQGRLRGSEMSDSTITVTNLGDRGVEVVHGVIYPPQVALVGFGKITGRPAVIDEEVVPRRQVTISLAADHRATDGALGARFLNTIDQLLQKPEEL